MTRGQIEEIIAIVTVFGIMVGLTLWRSYRKRKAIEQRITTKLKKLDDLSGIPVSKSRAGRKPDR